MDNLLPFLNQMNPIPSFIGFRLDKSGHTPTNLSLAMTRRVECVSHSVVTDQASGASKVTDRVFCMFSS